jgi:hypothetical protein
MSNAVVYHTYDLDTDRCKCGAEVVYFERCYDMRSDEVGEGCEVMGLPWPRTKNVEVKK